MNIFPIEINILALIGVCAVISKIFFNNDLSWWSVLMPFILGVIFNGTITLDW